MLTEDLELEMSDSFLCLSVYHLSRKTTPKKQEIKNEAKFPFHWGANALMPGTVKKLVSDSLNCLHDFFYYFG